MYFPNRFVTTMFFGAVSGFGFYAVSAPAKRMSTFAVEYFFPTSVESGQIGAQVRDLSGT
jgi:hypothetical protein